MAEEKQTGKVENAMIDIENQLDVEAFEALGRQFLKHDERLKVIIRGIAADWKDNDISFWNKRNGVNILTEIFIASLIMLNDWDCLDEKNSYKKVYSLVMYERKSCEAEKGYPSYLSFNKFDFCFHKTTMNMGGDTLIDVSKWLEKEFGWAKIVGIDQLYTSIKNKLKALNEEAKFQVHIRKYNKSHSNFLSFGTAYYRHKSGYDIWVYIEEW
eukprot:172381_1